MARLVILLIMVLAAGCSAPLTTGLTPPDEPAYIEGTIIDRDNRFTGSLSARVSGSGGQVADIMLESGPRGGLERRHARERRRPQGRSRCDRLGR
jgi:hypothetical protein